VGSESSAESNDELSTKPSEEIPQSTAIIDEETDGYQLMMETLKMVYRLGRCEEFPSIMALGDVHFFYGHFTTSLQFYLQSVSIPSNFFTAAPSSPLLLWLSTTGTASYLAPLNLSPILCRIISCLHHTHSNLLLIRDNSYS